jgi:peptide/nickel transport system substrate-binding protein
VETKHLHRKSLTVIILLAALAVFFALGAGPAGAASEPGTVTIVLSAEPENLDPGTTSEGNVGVVLLKNVLEPLTEVSPVDSKVMPRLATAWKQIDANTWQFTLRKGVKFHDGKEFDAKAVLFNMERTTNKKQAAKVGLKYFSHFKMTGKTLDSHLLEIKTDKPEPLLPSLMSTMALCSPGSPLEERTAKPIGTGPYKFAKWDAGMQVVLERFDGYWGAQPQVKKAVYVWRAESGVRAAMVGLGEADLTPYIAKQDANRPDMDQTYLNSETSYYRIGAWEPPLNDRRVRLALNYAIDRDAFRGSILSKDSIPATQMIVPSIFGHNPDLKPYPYDPQKAKQLLDEARKDGVPVQREIILVGGSTQQPGNEEILEAMMTMYRAVGLNVKIKLLETAAKRTYEMKPYPKDAGPYLLQKSHDNNKGDAVFTVFGKYDCNGNQSPICDKQLDEIMGKAQKATGEERRSLWQAAFKRIHEELVPDVMLFHMVGYCRVGKRINFKPSLATTSEVQLAQITFK